MGVSSTSSITATATMNGTTHNQSLARGCPVVGSRGALSRSLCLTVAQRRLPSSRRTMIVDRTNNQIKPSASSTILLTPNARGSDSKSGASSGKTIQPRMPIGTVASAQTPRIFAREYCSVRLSSLAHLVVFAADIRSEEHTSELQSRQYLVCRLLLEKKNKTGNSAWRSSTATTAFPPTGSE